MREKFGGLRTYAYLAEKGTPMYALSPLTEKFYTLNPVGVSMATYNELKEITTALNAAADLYVKIMEDGKVDWNDLSQNLPAVIDLVPKLQDAVVIKYPIIFSELQEPEIAELLSDAIGVIFKIGKFVPGTSPTTYKDLKEVVAVFAGAVDIFESMCADGKITLMDVPGNLGSLISLTSLLGDAAKFDGKVDLLSLTKEQMSELILAILQNCVRVINSVKKLQS